MIYLDNAAMKKPYADVVNDVVDILNDNWCNPNSIHSGGIESKKLIENTKEIISKKINCDKCEIIFCSCGSEANSLAILGYLMENNKSKFITSMIEHPSIAEIPYASKIVSVNNYGFFNMDDIKDIHNSLVSLQMANSEIGTIQDIKNIVKMLHKNNCVVHTDAVAAFGKINIDVRDLDIDMLTATGQKIGSILGGAFLYKKRGIKLKPLIYGHGTLRGGTPNVPAIASLGKSIELSNSVTTTPENRNYVWNFINKNITDSYLVGSPIGNNRLPDNAYVCFRGISGESLLVLLDMYGIYVGTGSACSSGSLEPSKTLIAIGMKNKDINSCVRFSFNGKESYDDLQYICNVLKKCVNKLRQF